MGQADANRFWNRYFTSGGAVGIWHEMLSVGKGAYQCIHGDMPATVLGAIRGLKPVTSGEHGGYQRVTEPIFHTQLADLPRVKEGH